MMNECARTWTHIPRVPGRRVSLAVAILLTTSACSQPAGPEHRTAEKPDTVAVPLTDLGTGTYRGLAGGLYPDGRNQMPAEHFAAGLERARRIRPLSAEGQPSSSGKVVLLSIGMSNTSQEFCGRNVTRDCWRGSFLDQAASDPSVNRSTLVIVNGAQGGRDAQSWTKAGNSVYDMVRDERLRPLGVTRSRSR